MFLGDPRQPEVDLLHSSACSGFAQIFRQLVSIKVKKVSNTNLGASRYIKREKALFLLDIRVAQKHFSFSPLMLGVTPYDGLASHLGGIRNITACFILMLWKLGKAVSPVSPAQWPT